MATPGNPESIGEVRVNINADTTGLRTGIQEARAETERFGQESERSGRKVESSARRATSAFRNLATAIRAVQAAIRTLVLPVIILASVFRLRDAWNAANRAVEDYRRSLGDVGSDLEREALRLHRINAGMTEDSIEQNELRDQALKQLDEITEKARQYRDETGTLKLLWREVSTAIGWTNNNLAEFNRITEESKQKVIKALEAAQQQLLINQQNARLQKEQERVEKQRLDTLREQERFSAARMSADISRMAQLLDIIRRQRGGRP